MIYSVLFLTGFFGVIAMVVMGFVHVGGHEHGHAEMGHGHSHGSLDGHGPSLGHNHAHVDGGHVQGHAHGAVSHHGGNHATPVNSEPTNFAMVGLTTALSVLSPLNLFSYALGAGAVGLLAQKLLPPIPLAAAAVIGAILFNLVFVKGLMRIMMAFTRPSDGLESMVAQPAEAVTRFDDAGKGLVRLCLDGQNVQILATLDTFDLEKGVKVNKGERLIITEVDSRRNTCRVTREMD